MNKPFSATRLLLTAMLALAVNLTVAAAPPPSALPSQLALSWTGNPATSMTVTWRCASSVTEGIVEYQEGSELTTEATTAKSECATLSTDRGSVNIFSATLTDLKPNTRYSYRAGNKDNWSTTRAFTTADPNATSFKFLVFGDSQSDAGDNPPYPEWRRTVQAAFKANPDARFMVNTGDLVDWGADNRHWNAWFAAAEGVIDSIPAMAVVGNHDAGGSSGDKGPEYYRAHFTLPRNGPQGLEEEAYSFDYGNAHFAMLTTERGRGGFGPQTNWLDSDLSASKESWKFAFFHRPPYDIVPIRQNDAVRDAFCPVLEKHHTDVVFSGHDHGFARTYPISSGKAGKQPSKGTVYYIVGRSGEKWYDGLRKHECHSILREVKDKPNYLVVEVTEKKLTVTARKVDGSLLDAYFIDRETDTCTDTAK